MKEVNIKQCFESGFKKTQKNYEGLSRYHYWVLTVPDLLQVVEKGNVSHMWENTNRAIFPEQEVSIVWYKVGRENIEE